MLFLQTLIWFYFRIMVNDNEIIDEILTKYASNFIISILREKKRPEMSTSILFL